MGESEVRRWRVREANKAVSIMVNKGFRQVRTGLILSFQDDPMARCDRASSQTQQASMRIRSTSSKLTSSRRLHGPPTQVMAHRIVPGVVKGFEAKVHEQGKVEASKADGMEGSSAFLREPR